MEAEDSIWKSLKGQMASYLANYMFAKHYLSSSLTFNCPAVTLFDGLNELEVL